MAKVKGNALLVYVNDVAIGCTTNCEFSSENTEIEATCKDNDGEYDSIDGGNNAQITFEGLHDTDATLGLSQVLTAHKNKTEIAVRMGIAGSGGLYIQAARAAITTLTYAGPLNGIATYNGTIRIRGTWSHGTHT